MNYLRTLSATLHGRIVLAGLLVGLVYLPAWLHDLIVRSMGGSTGLVLILSAVASGAMPLWRGREGLQQMVASEGDRYTGCLLVLGGLALFPFFRAALWSQALIWLFVIVGIVLTLWGTAFFIQYPLTAFLIPLTVYTRPGVIAQGAWRFVMPPFWLEDSMAAVSTQVLQWMGQPATATGRFITMPSVTVEVAWRCNGFNMAVAMAVTGLLLGIFFKRSRQQIGGLTAIGAVVGLAFNVPRIMLIVMAAAYWGDRWFNFWHGSWGAQLFVGLLFTVYYQIAIIIINKQLAKTKHKSDAC